PPSSVTSRQAEIAIGERLFKETRFAQAFLIQSKGDVNATNISGDPALNTNDAPGSPHDGVFKGKTMSCRQCHLEDEFEGVPGAGLRIYTDFARRTPIPAREDGKTVTTRNSPTLVGASLGRRFFFQHYDGEFTTPQDLVIGGFTGRNFGWLATESGIALKNIANVIRFDNGTGELAQQYGGSYAKVFGGDPSVPAQFRLPRQYQMNLTLSSDAKIIAAVANLVSAYMYSLDFGRDASGAHNKSPYDVFLMKNNLPRAPAPLESTGDYSRRLAGMVNALANPIFVTPADGKFTTHAQAFQFGADEIAGMKLFFAPPAPPAPPQNGPGAPGIPRRGSGNCVSCHHAPEFTDFVFHNTGVTQLEYDGVFGRGAFEALKIPSLSERIANPAAALPANSLHPDYSGAFRSIPTAGKPGQVDLGLWSVFANPDYPKAQPILAQLALAEFGPVPTDVALNRTIASFKTPGLRDLGHSQPYQHNGKQDTTRDVVDFYAQAGALMRSGHLRNGDPRMGGIALTPVESLQVSKFLDSLNEDFTE
ncbi:MAG: hypothetical protein WCT04_22890, partial [Planctomycetota bacterium]